MMKKAKTGWIAAIVITAAAVPLAYKLFEPVFVYRSGWQALPESLPAARGEILDGKWAAQGEAALKSIDPSRQKLDTPALSAAVSIDGQVVWRGVAGLADIETGRAADFDTRFRLGSTSKAVTAVAAGTLLATGKLDVNKPIQDYVPTYPQQKWPMTLGQVMSHRAGIRDYGMCACFPIWEHQNRRHFEDVNAEVAVIARSPLVFRPGTDFKYTSLGYNLTGAAIEHASGQSFGAYIEAAVLKPLGMMHTGLDAVPGSARDLAGFYETEGGQYKRAFSVDNSIRWPSGGFVSTPSDMAKLGNAMLDDRLLPKSTRALLVTVPAGGSQSRGGKVYALGWRHSPWTIHNGKLKLDAYHHAGTAVGSTSVFVVFPERHMVVSIMMNKGGENADGLAEAADRIIEAFVPAPK